MNFEFEIYNKAVDNLELSLKKLQRFYPNQYSFKNYLNFLQSKSTAEILAMQPKKVKHPEEIDEITNLIHAASLINSIMIDIYGIVQEYEEHAQDVKFLREENERLKDENRRLRIIQKETYQDIAEMGRIDKEILELVNPKLKMKESEIIKKMIF